MRTRASCKRLVLPILTVFSISLWILAFACDVIRVGGAPGDAWSSVALFSTVGAPSQGGRSASQETRADLHGPQALRRCAECGLYPATRNPTSMGSGMSTSGSAFDRRFRTVLGFSLAWRPDDALCKVVSEVVRIARLAVLRVTGGNLPAIVDIRRIE